MCRIGRLAQFWHSQRHLIQVHSTSCLPRASIVALMWDLAVLSSLLSQAQACYSPVSFRTLLLLSRPPEYPSQLGMLSFSQSVALLTQLVIRTIFASCWYWSTFPYRPSTLLWHSSWESPSKHCTHTSLWTSFRICCLRTWNLWTWWGQWTHPQRRGFWTRFFPT